MLYHNLHAWSSLPFCLAAITFAIIYSVFLYIICFILYHHSPKKYYKPMWTYYSWCNSSEIFQLTREKVFVELIWTFYTTLFIMIIILLCIPIILKYIKIHIYSLRIVVFLEVRFSHQVGSRWIMEFSPVT